METLPLPLITFPTSVVPLPPRSPFPVTERGKFIKQFDGPEEGSGVVCFKFWQLVHASGCPFQCAYCFLQTTTYFRMKKEALRGQIYSNWEQMIEEVREFLASPTPRMLLVGELQDGLAFDHAYVGVTGKPLTHHLIPLFAAQAASPDFPDQEHPHQTCNQARTDTAGRIFLVGKCRVRWP